MVSMTAKPTRASSGSRLSTVRRKRRELQLVQASTKEYLTGKDAGKDVISLQEIKNVLKNEKGNPFGMHLEPSHSNAQIQTDMVHLCVKGIHDTEGKPHRLHAKEWGTRVIFLDTQMARELIASEKDKKKQDAMKEHLNKFMQLPNRPAYQAQ